MSLITINVTVFFLSSSLIPRFLTRQIAKSTRITISLRWRRRSWLDDFYCFTYTRAFEKQYFTVISAIVSRHLKFSVFRKSLTIVVRRIRLIRASHVRQFIVETHKPVICAMHMYKPDWGSRHVNTVFAVTGKSVLSVGDYARRHSSSLFDAFR